jgi:Zn-dependent peptidase ImmA (M78 family)
LEGFLVESLAHGLLQALGVKGPPVPVRDMIRVPHPVFESLGLLELNLGLYDAVYRSLINGSGLIAVDLDHPPVIQRFAMARELYVAFCCSPRAAELDWPDRDHAREQSGFFARCLLMPATWVKQVHARTDSLVELADAFGVSTEMMARRLRELSIELTT